MPAPAAKVLWQAGNEVEWVRLYMKWLARWDGRGYLQGEMEKIESGIVMQSRAEKWLEETDEFGISMAAMRECILHYGAELGLIEISQCDGVSYSSDRQAWGVD